MTKPIDLAIRSAALSILAACSPPASSPDDVTRDDRRGPDSLVVDDGEVLQHEEVRVEAPDPRDPTATCVEYRESVSGTSADPRGLPAKPRQRRMGPPSQEVWGGRVGGGIQCTLTWDVTEADVEVTVTPTCCPMPGGRQQPCPPPHKQMMRGHRGIEERVVIDPAGQPRERQIEWVVYEPSVPMHACGRRPEGFELRDAPTPGLAGELATMAALESASVAAFRRLARELRHHGAPRELVERAEEAARDEVRHARTLRRLASARGGRVLPWRRSRLPVRSCLAIAAENAIEGCVREAFGAALAVVQANSAADAELRDAFRIIADDECRHAALAWDVHGWLMGRATPEERSVVAELQRQALASLDHGHAEEATRRALGLPDALASRALAAALGKELGIAA